MQSQRNQHEPSTILFTHYGDNWIRGSERCLLDLLKHLDRSCFNPIVWCNSKTMADEVRKLDIPVIESDFPILFGWQRPRFAFKAFYNLIKQGIKLIDTYDVKLIHVNSGAPNQWLNFVARARHIPLLTHLHSRYPLRDRVSLGLQQVPMAVGVSQPVIEQLLDNGMSAECTCVIANGIDAQSLSKQKRVDLRQLLNLDNKELLIATTGSLIHRKGTDMIIEAVFRLLKQGIPISLVIIGDGPERENLQQQINQLGLSNKIHMLGERSDVVGLLSGGVDLFVSSAREEVFGLALAEAGLADLAVVAPKVGGIPSVILDGETGVLFPAEDISSLTRVIHELYKAPLKREAMGRSGHRHVLKNFNIKRNVHQFEQLYMQMLHNPAMRMHWFSHWKIRHSFINTTRKLLVLIRYQFIKKEAMQ